MLPKQPVILYHNPSCSKSREALSLLITMQGIAPGIVLYLAVPLLIGELVHLLQLLRSGSPRNLIQAMHNHPNLIKKLGVVYNNTASIGNPPENILTVLPLC